MLKAVCQPTLTRRALSLIARGLQTLSTEEEAITFIKSTKKNSIIAMHGTGLKSARGIAENGVSPDTRLYFTFDKGEARKYAQIQPKPTILAVVTDVDRVVKDEIWGTYSTDHASQVAEIAPDSPAAMHFYTLFKDTNQAGVKVVRQWCLMLASPFLATLVCEKVYEASQKIQLSSNAVDYAVQML